MNIKFLTLILISLVVFNAVACQQSSPTAKVSAANSPTEAFKQLFAAVKSKNTAAIKACMSKASQGLAEGTAQMQKSTPEQVYRNGFTETTMSEQLPPMRDERIKDNFGALEVQNPKGQWEDLPFVNEDGGWKLAVGDVFKNTFKHPGQPAARQNSSAAQPAMPPVSNNSSPVNPNSKNPIQQLPNNAAPTTDKK